MNIDRSISSLLYNKYMYITTYTFGILKQDNAWQSIEDNRKGKKDISFDGEQCLFKINKG